MAGKKADLNRMLPLIRRVVRENYRSHWKGYAAALVLMGIAAVATAASAWIVRDVVNDLFVSGQQSLIIYYGLFIGAVSIVRGFATYGHVVILSRIGNDIVASMKATMYDKLLVMQTGYFADRHSSRFIANLNYNANCARTAMNLLATSLGRDLLTVVALIGVMVVLDPVLAVVALLVAPPIIFSVGRIVKQTRVMATQEAGFAANIVRTAMETARGIDVVKSFGIEDTMRARMGKDLDRFRQRLNRLESLQASTGPIMETVGGLAVGGLILYAAWQANAAGKTPGEFLAFITAFLLAYEPAKRLARLHIQLGRNLVGLGLMYDFLDSPMVELDRPGAVDLAIGDGAVTCESVTFGYTDGRPVVDNVSFEARGGEVVALAGPSGGGKSTLFALLLRFGSPWSGRITIDGQDIANATLKSLRSAISTVSQQAFLFSGTIGENIAMGRPGATPGEIRDAARAAYALEFIRELPDGFDTHVGENGTKLSGGQRQRIAIARALLKNAPILLLDEATSALDTVAERQVQLALETLMAGRTTIVIAHRLSTIARANRICVLQHGRVVETGTHSELIGNKGAYALLHQVAEHDDDKLDSA